jgi:hypothetical protein
MAAGIVHGCVTRRNARQTSIAQILRECGTREHPFSTSMMAVRAAVRGKSSDGIHSLVMRKRHSPHQARQFV